MKDEEEDLRIRILKKLYSWIYIQIRFFVHNFACIFFYHPADLYCKNNVSDFHFLLRGAKVFYATFASKKIRLKSIERRT